MNNKIHILLTLIIFISLNSFGQIPQDSLLLYYSFDGNAADSSGNGFDGIVQGATLTTDRFGNPNSAYFFDGTNDFIEMPNVPQLKPELPISISFWANLESLSQLDNQFFSTSPVNGNYAGCAFNTTSNGNGGININYGDNNGGNNSNYRRTKSVPASLSLGNWHHIVGIYRGPLDMDVYINCVLLDGEYSGTGGALGYANVPGSIGRSQTASAYYHWGAIDDFAIYNKSLDSCEVVLLYSDQDCKLSISENINTDPPFKVSPNPSNGIFTIEKPIGLNKPLDIRVLDSKSKLIFEQTIAIDEKKVNIDISNYASGIYYLEIGVDEQILTQKIMKN